MLSDALVKSPGSTMSPRRRRLQTVAKCLALLVVPLLTWLFFAPRTPEPVPRKPQVGSAREPSAIEVASAPAQRAAPLPGAPAEAPPAAHASSGAPAIEGDVLDPRGDPAADASVTCKVGEQEFEGQSDGSGRFRLPTGALGCEATATKHGFGPSGAVTLAASGNRLRLTPPAGIAGHVVDEAGAPLMSYWIAVESFEPADAPARANGKPADLRPPRKIALEVDDVAGAFEWDDLAVGRYALAVSVPNRPLARARGIDVRPGTITRGIRIVTSAGTTVVGRVTEARTGQPLDGSLVFVELTLAAELGLKALPARSQPGGEFTLEGAPREVFDLHVLRTGYFESTVRGLKPRANGEPLRVDVKMSRWDEPPTDGGGSP